MEQMWQTWEDLEKSLGIKYRETGTRKQLKLSARLTGRISSENGFKIKLPSEFQKQKRKVAVSAKPMQTFNEKTRAFIDDTCYDSLSSKSSICVGVESNVSALQPIGSILSSTPIKLIEPVSVSLMNHENVIEDSLNRSQSTPEQTHEQSNSKGTSDASYLLYTDTTETQRQAHQAERNTQEVCSQTRKDSSGEIYLSQPSFSDSNVFMEECYHLLGLKRQHNKQISDQHTKHDVGESTNRSSSEESQMQYTSLTDRHFSRSFVTLDDISAHLAHWRKVLEKENVFLTYDKSV